MSPSTLLRVAARGASSTFVRANVVRQPLVARARVPAIVANSFSTSARRCVHEEETFEEFTSRFEKEFEQVQDVFELQRNLNNAFAYDLVPAPSVIVAALNAARRVNDFATAVRVFEAIKAKVETPAQYQQYLDELAPLREEFGIHTKEELFPEEK
ncbi:probable cytochrome-c oxidase chain VI precursor [Cephalotrichum gorgonifer]|uniref:Cytochrome c oxidase subunit 6, mitochondrial n=1 Tax=Cephalotrichum gorgonifer TaxID=2041049 RepID=A0AAE8MQG1_9PEZI|nr:probable cytochrome-c oxidase chain VI precursor [Cephalotrichum gorgonifer]